MKQQKVKLHKKLGLSKHQLRFYSLAIAASLCDLLLAFVLRYFEENTLASAEAIASLIL